MVKPIYPYSTKYLITKGVPCGKHAQCYKVPQLLCSLFKKHGARESEHAILANLLSPHISSLERGSVADQDRCIFKQAGLLSHMHFLGSVSEMFWA